MSEQTLQKRPAARSATGQAGARSKSKPNGEKAAPSPKVQALEGMKTALNGPNRTGLPDRLKGVIERMSGVAMDRVRVLYNSAAPARISAAAFTQGREIHLGPGEERHLPHEAWHVVQQAQGRVSPTGRLHTGAPVNDDPSLEREADRMGARATAANTSNAAAQTSSRPAIAPRGGGVAQGMFRGVVSGVKKAAPIVRNFASGAGGGSGGDDHLRRLAMQQMKEAEKSVASSKKPPPIPRVQAVTHGPNFGYLKSDKSSLFRFTLAKESVMRNVDQGGFTSSAERQGLKPPKTPPTDPQEITAYSGTKGKSKSSQAGYKTSRLVGFNEDALHTVNVGSKTAKRGNYKPGAKDPTKHWDPGEFGRFDELPRGPLDKANKLSSVKGAFEQTGEQNKYPVEGEHVAHETVDPSYMGHAVTVPPSRRPDGAQLGQPGQAHPDYMKNLGSATGATARKPQGFDITTNRHPDPANPGEFIEIDRFDPTQDPDLLKGATPGREGQYKKRVDRMRRKLKAKKDGQ